MIGVPCTWTIWESLFSIENRNIISEQEIYNTKGEKKISYILSQYLAINLPDNDEKLKLLVKARNRLIHFGKMHPDVSMDIMKAFIQVTDQVIAQVLGLTPKSVSGSLGKVRTFLNLT